MKYWTLPPKIKVYEALGCLADGRIEIDSIYSFLSSHPYSLLGPKTKPPVGY